MDDFRASTVRTSGLDRLFAYLGQRRPSDRALLSVAAIVFIVAGAISLLQLNNSLSATYPARGGEFTEGILGTPRFINPALAITQADHDLVTLLYRGVMTLSADGTIVPDLAESVTVSDDGTVYNIILKENIFFTDGEAIQADDVLYTIGLIQDAALKSPARGSWSGITLEPVSEREFNLILEEAYTPFIENLTLGVLPKHVWEQLSIEELPFSQHNIEPIGSGPYQIKTVVRNPAGLVEEYVLTAVDEDNTNIDTLRMRFYQSVASLTAALRSGEILASASLEHEAANQLLATERFTLISEPLPRVFAVFINQNRTAALRDEAARQALSAAVHRPALIDTVLGGFGIPTTSPVPHASGALQSSGTSSVATSTESALARARTILEEGGWEQAANGRWVKEISDVETELAITITTANTPAFETTATYLETVWSELGVDVSLALYEQSDLVQSVIRPRDYQALLFGTDIGRARDLYPFWHSSQRADPGLNVALYANITTDQLLDRSRTEQDPAARLQILDAVATEIQTETPAIFLYNPSHVYLVHNSVTAVPTPGIQRASERFTTITSWYMSEEELWPIFR